jgi:hypothetical protein
MHIEGHCLEGGDGADLVMGLVRVVEFATPAWACGMPMATTNLDSTLSQIATFY